MNVIITTILIRNNGTTEIITTKTENGITHQKNKIINNIQDKTRTVGTIIRIILRKIIIKIEIISETNKIAKISISILKDQINCGNKNKKNQKILLITFRIR
jgi:hypothetical protein